MLRVEARGAGVDYQWRHGARRRLASLAPRRVEPAAFFWRGLLDIKEPEDRDGALFIFTPQRVYQRRARRLQHVALALYQYYGGRRRLVVVVVVVGQRKHRAARPKVVADGDAFLSRERAQDRRRAEPVHEAQGAVLKPHEGVFGGGADGHLGERWTATLEQASHAERAVARHALQMIRRC